jgi:hypothetical protein
MRFSKRSERRPRRPLSACLLLLFLFRPATLPAQELVVEYASTKIVDRGIYVDAGINYQLDEEILLALEHGVEVDIQILVRVRRDREWLWDPLVAEQQVRYRLQHHPLSDDYVLTDLATGERQQFASRDGALRAAGRIKNVLLGDASLLEPGNTYRGYMKVKLQVENLPAPLEPITYVSEAWRMESSWYEWVVR